MNLKLSIGKKLKSIREFNALPGHKRVNCAFLIGSLNTHIENMMGHAKCHVDIVRSDRVKQVFSYSKRKINFYLPLFSNKFKLRVRLQSTRSFYDVDYIFAQSVFVIYSEALNTINIKYSGLTYSLFEDLEHLLISTYVSFIAASFWKIDFDEPDIFDKLVFFDKLSHRHYEGHPSELAISIKPKIKPSKSISNLEKVQLGPDLLDSKKTRTLFTGHRTILECDNKGQICDIKSLAPVDDTPHHKGDLYLAPYEYQPVFAYSTQEKSLCLVLNRHGDLMIFIDGNLLAMRREDTWRIFSSMNFVDQIASILGQIQPRKSDDELLSMLSIYIGIFCFSLRNRRKGGLIVIANKNRIKQLLPSKKTKQRPVEVLYQKLVSGEPLINIPFELLCNAISVDGATLIDIDSKLHKFGAVLNVPFHKSNSEGARTKAAEYASKYGLAIKISEDGPITLYFKSKIEYQVD